MIKNLLTILLLGVTLLVSPSLFSKESTVLVASFTDGKFYVYPGTKCTSKKVAKVLKAAGADELFPDLSKAKVIFKGKTIPACFALRADGLVVVVGEDGNGALLPASEFVPETEI